MRESDLIVAFCFCARKHIHNGPKIEESLDDWFFFSEASVFLSPRDLVSLKTWTSCQTNKLVLLAIVGKYDQGKFCYCFQSVDMVASNIRFPLNILNQLK